MTPQAPPPPPPDVPTSVREETVGMIDCDPFQIHFAAYYRWVDLGYSALTESLAANPLAMLEEGFAAPCVHSDCAYVAPLRYGDRFTVTTWIGTAGRTSFTVQYRFERDGELTAQASTTHVWTSYGPPPRKEPLPSWVLDAAAEHRRA